MCVCSILYSRCNLYSICMGKCVGCSYYSVNKQFQIFRFSCLLLFFSFLFLVSYPTIFTQFLILELSPLFLSGLLFSFSPRHALSSYFLLCLLHILSLLFSCVPLLFPSSSKCVFHGHFHNVLHTYSSYSDNHRRPTRTRGWRQAR